MSDPCKQVADQETAASIWSNLTSLLFGPITKTVTNGIATWTTPCNPNDNVAGFARGEGEGLICYILRILESTVATVALFGRMTYKYTAVSYEAQGSDTAIVCTNTTPIVITLKPQADLDDGKFYKIKKKGAGTVTITPTGETIDSAATYVLATTGMTVEVLSPRSGDWEIL